MGVRIPPIAPFKKRESEMVYYYTKEEQEEMDKQKLRRRKDGVRKIHEDIAKRGLEEVLFDIITDPLLYKIQKGI